MAPVATFEVQLFAHAVHPLPLLKRKDVRADVILVHKQAVAEMEVGSNGRKGELLGFILYVESRMKESAAITALAILGDEVEEMRIRLRAGG